MESEMSSPGLTPAAKPAAARGAMPITFAFLLLASGLFFVRSGADTMYDEPIYARISRSVWEAGRPLMPDSPEAPAYQREAGGPLFHDSPVLVPCAAAPVAEFTRSWPLLRAYHWLLFVLPGLLALAVLLREYGPMAMAVGCFALLVNQSQTQRAGFLNLDQALSSWGFLAVYCFARRRWLLLGLFAMAACTLAKYQALVVCAVLLLVTLVERHNWKQLLLYGVVSAAALFAWVLYLSCSDRWSPSDSTFRFAWGPDFLRRVLAERGHNLKYLLWYAVSLRLGIPLLAFAVVGVIRRRSDPLVRSLGCYVALTFLFNVATAAMPGGLDYYLTPAFLPLAACCGVAFAGRTINPLGAAACLALAALKNVVPLWTAEMRLGTVLTPVAVVAGTALVGLAALLYAVGWKRAHWAFMAATLVYFLPFALPLKCPGEPDQGVRALVARAAARGWEAGAWEDPRVNYYSDQRVLQAVWDDDWGRPDYYILLAHTLVRQKDDDRWRQFQQFLRTHYAPDEQTGDYIGWRRLPAPQ
jgi:hypothetical protein